MRYWSRNNPATDSPASWPRTAELHGSRTFSRPMSHSCNCAEKAETSQAGKLPDHPTQSLRVPISTSDTTPAHRHDRADSGMSARVACDLKELAGGVHVALSLTVGMHANTATHGLRGVVVGVGDGDDALLPA